MTAAVNAVSQAEFARLEGKARSYITALKNAGRLVMTADGKVDVEASRARLTESADPNRDDVTQRWQQARTKTAEPEPAEVMGNGYQAARAVKEKYAAMQAKLEYERAVGKMIEKAEVQAATTDVVTTLRQALENMPHRTAPELVGKDLNAIRATLKQEIHGALAEMEREFTKRIEAMGGDEK